MGATAARMADTSTEEYAKRLDAPQDGSTLKDVGLRVMGGITDFNDMMTFGHASKLANWVDGKGYVDNETAGRSLTPAAPANTAQPAPAQPAPLALRGDATGPADHPNAPMADATSYLATCGRNGKLPEDLSRLREGSIYKTIGPNGNPIYSGRNVSGDAPMVDGKGNTLRMGGNVSTVPGMDPALIASTLRNPDGSKWSAQDNAIMAANLRDGVDPYRGTSRAPKEEDRIPAIGEFGHNKALANQTLRRGQDIQSADNRYGHDLSAATARANTRFQMQKDQRDFAVGRYDKDVEQAGKFDEQARSAFKHKFDSIDKDGKLSARPDLEAAAYDEAMRQSNGRWSQLDPAQRAAYLSDAFDHVKLLSSARNHQNNSIWQAVGLANKDAAHGGMPSAADMQGAKLTELGFGSGATTMNAGRGDYKLTLKNGQVMHFGRGDLSQAQLKRLQDLGASLGDK